MIKNRINLKEHDFLKDFSCSILIVNILNILTNH